MSWFNSLMRRSAVSRSSDKLSAEVAAIFEKTFRYLHDEDPQTSACRSLSDRLLQLEQTATSCPDSRAPIPVNGPLGEVMLLANREGFLTLRGRLSLGGTLTGECLG
jgi:hypothetical protein